MRTPLSTYRLQFNKDFPFARARDLVPYLSRLGISHLYASPVFRARAGSLHGYDVVDQSAINPELGGEEGFLRLSDALNEAGLSIMQDVVPNHMAYDSQNAMLMDVLEKGPHSQYKDFFDIDWNHIYENLRGRLLVPFLGSFYAEALENGELRLAYGEEGLSLNYYALRLPLRIESYIKVFGAGAGPLESALGGESPDIPRFIGAVSMFKTLSPAPDGPYPGEQAAHAKKMLWTLYSSSPGIKEYMDGVVAGFNGRKGEPDSFDALDELVSEQFYRPSYWKVAAEEINYRRFFTINELISLKIEDGRVFDYVHGTALKLIKEGRITALRVDHVDGLIDPQRYLERLRTAAGEEVYIALEKILAHDEELPSSWPVQGTTGYDFTNYVNGLFCRGESERDFSRSYYRFAGLDTPYDDLVCAKKRMMISRHLAGNIDNLAHTMKRTAANDRYGRDITLYGLRRALVEVMANFPVYRTYVNSEAGPTEAEKAYIRTAVEGARRRLQGFGYELNFIEAFLLMEQHESLCDERRCDVLDFVMSFQQYTAPLMAKGFEDTILYIYNKLSSLNEVGSAPNLFGFTIDSFHAFNARKAATTPLSMNATSTHDTKRSEDVRARINVLSEMSSQWNSRLRAWAKMNAARKRKSLTGVAMPDRNEEYLLYQTLLGSWPAEGEAGEEFASRMKAYALKASREAQINTNWVRPNSEYEEALAGFIDRLLQPGEENRFLQDFLAFQKEISFYGFFNSLSQTLLKIAAPGVPDLYQGCELWDFSMVDPDNRRPVDFPRRAAMLAALEERWAKDPASLPAELLGDLPSGRIKLFLIWRALTVRRELKEVFEAPDYLELKAEGPFARNAVVFARRGPGGAVIAAVPRYLTDLVKPGQTPAGGLWQDTRVILPPELAGDWTDAFTGKTSVAGGDIPLSSLFGTLPFSLLYRKG